jgi:hypothetical protein
MSATAKHTPETDQYLLDTVMFLASLSSEARVIAPLLEQVRDVTAKLQLGHKLNERDRRQLEHVSFQLRDHLLHRDAVRQFTPEALRDVLTERFGTQDTPPQRRQTLLDVGLILMAGVTSFILGVAFTAYCHWTSG